MAASGTRKKLYLIEEYKNDIKGAKLLSNKQVLSHFFYLHQQQGETVLASARQAVEKVEGFWQKQIFQQESSSIALPNWKSRLENEKT